MAKLKMSYAELISQAQVMATGLKSKIDEVSKRGLESAFVTEMEKLCAEAIALNSEQECLKAELKTRTEALNEKLELLSAKLSESKKVVKLAIPQVGWLEFGIADKR